MDEIVEIQLIRRSQRGDHEAFDQLMQAHHERVYRLAFRLTGSADEADGVTQDTFVQAYCSLRQFKGRSRFMTWLYSIAVRKALDLRRERHSSRETLSLADPPADSRRPSSSGPLETLREKEFAALLSDAMMKLPRRPARGAHPDRAGGADVQRGRAHTEFPRRDCGLAGLEGPAVPAGYAFGLSGAVKSIWDREM